MPATDLNAVVRHLRRMASRDGESALTDEQLLSRFVQTGDHAAFEVLVWRHGSLVLGTCRKILAYPEDVEDAFQATFMVLARKAVSIAQRPALSGWLFQVTCRVSFRLKSQNRRHWRQRISIDLDDVPRTHNEVLDSDERDRLGVVVEEVHRLPERFRLPIVFCYLEGKTHAEASKELNRPTGSMSHLLSRGCALLRARLVKRGFNLSAGALVVALRDRATASLTSNHVQLVVAESMRFFTGAVLGSRAALLARGGIRTLFFTKAKLALSLSLIFVGILGGAASLSQRVVRPPAELESEIDTPRDQGQNMVERTTGFDQLGDPLPEGAILRLGTTRFRNPTGSMNELALSPDGKWLAASGRLWDAATGKLLFDVECQRTSTVVAQHEVTFFSDSNKAFFISTGGTGVSALDCTTGKVQDVFPLVPTHQPGTFAESVALHTSPDGLLLAVGTGHGVRVVTLASGQVRWQTQIARQANRAGDDRLLWRGSYSLAMFTPDGKQVGVNDSDNAEHLRFLDAFTGEERGKIQLGARLVRMAFSSDSRLVAVTERDNAVRVYEVATGKRLQSWRVNLTNPNENYTSAVVFSPDGTMVAAGATDNLIHLWDLRTGRELDSLRGHAWYVTALVFAPDGQTLYSTGWDGAIRRWDTATRKEIPTDAKAATGLVAISPKGSLLAWEGASGEIHLADARTGSDLRTMPGNPAHSSKLAFSPDGSILAAGGADLSVQLWTTGTGKLLRQWTWPKGKDPYADVNDMSFTPDGTTLATATFRMSEVLLWNLQTGARLARARHPDAFGVSFAGDSRTLVSAGWDRAIRWWALPDLQSADVISQPEPAEKERKDPRFYALAYSPDFRLLATIDLNGEIVVWDATTHKRLVSFPAVNGQCNIAFSPDGQWLTAGGYDGTAGVWDVRTGTQVWKKSCHRSDIFSIAFGPLGKTLLTGSSDRTALLWDLRPQVDARSRKPMASLWEALSGAGTEAYQALWELADRPAETVVFLKDKLTPTQQVDKTRLPVLLRNLDSNKFTERATASEELAAMGDVIETDLREALTRSPSVEVRKRLQELLDGLSPLGTAEDARRTRAITILKWIATPESQKLLIALAKGAPGRRQTEDARLALEHMDVR